MDTRLFNVLLRGIAEALSGVRGLVILPLVARTVGIEGYGIYSQAIVSASVAIPMLSLSVENAVINEVSHIEPAFAREKAWTAMFIGILSGVLIVLICVLAPRRVGELIYGRGDWSEETIIVGLLCLCGIISLILQSYFQATKRITFATVLQVHRTILSAIAVAAGAIFDGRTTGILWWMLSIEFGYMLVLIGCLMREGIPNTIFNSTDCMRMIKYGAPLALSNVFYMITISVPRYIIVRYMTLADVGVYAATLAILMPIAQIVSPIQYVTYPETSRLWKSGREAEAKNILGLCIVIILVMSLPLIVASVALGTDVLRILTRGNIDADPHTFLLIGLGLLMMQLFRIGSTGLLIQGKTQSAMICNLVSATLCIVACLLLVPYIGIRGAAMSFMVGNCALVICGIRMGGESAGKEAIRRRSGLVLRSLAASLIAGSIAVQFQGEGLRDTSFRVIGFAIIYGISMLLLKGKKDIDSMWREWSGIA